MDVIDHALSTRTELAAIIASRLERDREALCRAWDNPEGTTTRHCVTDDLLPAETAQAVFRAFPSDGEGFLTRNDFREKKRTSFNLDIHPRILAETSYAFQDRRVLEAVAAITGIEELEPDPHLYAGGLSMMFHGHFLNPHIDNSHERTRTRYRRLNLLYYVAPDWNAENGGSFELWDEDVTRPVTVPALFNCLVLMETNRRSWHSVSPIIAAGPRCCVSNYYFSRQSPTGEDYYQVTSFTGRPEQRVRRMLGPLDNAARSLARKLGAKKALDKGYSGALAD